MGKDDILAVLTIAFTLVVGMAVGASLTTGMLYTKQDLVDLKCAEWYIHDNEKQFRFNGEPCRDEK